MTALTTGIAFLVVSFSVPALPACQLSFLVSGLAALAALVLREPLARRSS